MERIRFGQVFNSKRKFVGIEKTLSVQRKVYHVGINRSYDSLYDSLIEKKSQKGYVATVLEGLRSTGVMSKPNDLKQIKKGSQNKETLFNCLNNYILKNNIKIVETGQT